MKSLLLLLYLVAMTSIVNSQPQRPVVNHIALHVKDLQKTVAFYQNIIGLDTIPEPFHDGNHTWFSMGSAQLHLIGKAKEISLQSKQSHICFSVASVEDFTERLKKAGLLYEDVKGQANSITTRADGVKQIYFKDPDGYWLEVNDAKN